MADMVKRNTFLDYEVVDLAEEIKLVSPTDTPLTTMLMARGLVEKANDITVTWREKELNTTRGTLILEGAEAGEAIKSTRGSISNLCQIIEKVTMVSGTAQALQPKGVGDVFQSEVQDRLIETKRDLEWYYLNGTKTEESDGTPRQMNGLVNLVNSANVVTTASLKEEDIQQALKGMWDHGAQGEYYAFVNASQKMAINALAKSGANVRWDLENGSTTNAYGIGVSKLVTDFGTVNLVLDRHMDANTILFVDLDEVRIAELRGTFYEDLPKAGDYHKGHVINESSIKLLNSYAGAKIVVTA